jgi:hypothetical protein
LYIWAIPKIFKMDEKADGLFVWQKILQKMLQITIPRKSSFQSPDFNLKIIKQY